MRLPFSKYHGLGNDFIVLPSLWGFQGQGLVSSVDASGQGVAGLPEALDPGAPPSPAPPLGALQAQWLCDRHRGIGADGVLLALPPHTPGAVARMRIFNADGSLPEMCGNGLRCFARWLVERQGAAESLVVDTDAGPRRCVVRRRADAADGAWDVEVEMGVVRFERALLGWGGQGDARETFTVAGRAFDVRGVSVGNPHAVIAWDGDDTLTAAREYGPFLSELPAFAHRTNVEFVRVRPDGDLDVTVYERGCGITEACGTGAVAAVAALAAGERAATWVGVRLPGGRLEVRLDLADEPAASLRGPAVHVYDGELDGLRLARG